MRLTSFWTMATTLPTASDSMARAPIAGRQSSLNNGNATVNTRSNAANPATLVADDMNAVTGVGAPWYTSGVHMWNGTAATLKPRPTSNRAKPATSTPLDDGPPALRNASTLPSWVDPVAPYVSAMPYRKKADEKAPRRKYFMADSCGPRRWRTKPARM